MASSTALYTTKSKPFTQDEGDKAHIAAVLINLKLKIPLKLKQPFNFCP